MIFQRSASRSTCALEGVLPIFAVSHFSLLRNYSKLTYLSMRNEAISSVVNTFTSTDATFPTTMVSLLMRSQPTATVEDSPTLNLDMSDSRDIIHQNLADQILLLMDLMRLSMLLEALGRGISLDAAGKGAWERTRSGVGVGGDLVISYAFEGVEDTAAAGYIAGVDCWG